MSQNIFQLTRGREGMEKYSLIFHCKQLRPTVNLFRVVVVWLLCLHKVATLTIERYMEFLYYPQFLSASSLLCKLSAISSLTHVHFEKCQDVFAKKKASSQCLLAQKDWFLTPCMKINFRCIRPKCETKL